MSIKDSFKEKLDILREEQKGGEGTQSGKTPDFTYYTGKIPTGQKVKEYLKYDAPWSATDRPASHSQRKDVVGLRKPIYFPDTTAKTPDFSEKGQKRIIRKPEEVQTVAQTKDEPKIDKTPKKLQKSDEKLASKMAYQDWKKIQDLGPTIQATKAKEKATAEYGQIARDKFSKELSKTQGKSPSPGDIVQKSLSGDMPTTTFKPTIQKVSTELSKSSVKKDETPGKIVQTALGGMFENTKHTMKDFRILQEKIMSKK